MDSSGYGSNDATNGPHFGSLLQYGVSSLGQLSRLQHPYDQQLPSSIPGQFDDPEEEKEEEENNDDVHDMDSLLLDYDNASRDHAAEKKEESSAEENGDDDDLFLYI